MSHTPGTETRKDARRRRDSGIRSSRRTSGLRVLAACGAVLGAVVLSGAVVDRPARARTEGQGIDTLQVSSVSPQEGAYYELVSRHSGKAVDVARRSLADGARVVQWSPTGAPNQQFRFLPSGHGYYRIQARHSGKVLDGADGSRSDGPVVQRTDRNTTSQQWRTQDDAGFVSLVNRNSRKVLDVASWSTADGARVQQYSPRNGANQQWMLNRVGEPVTPTPVPTRSPTPTFAPTATPTSTAPTTTPTPTTSTAPTTAPTTAPAKPTTSSSTGTRRCEDYASVTEGKYWINNNVWGKSSGTGTQCIQGGSVNGSTIGWSTDWGWSGKSNSVKTYASAVLGWHWGTKIANTGLPVQVSAGRKVQTHWSYRLTEDGPSTLDVSYDLWLHQKSNPTYADTPTDEVMVWLHRSGGAGPVGTKQATVTVDGTTWDLYRGNIGWNVFSFVRQTNSDDSTVDLSDFLDTLSARGWMDPSKYLSSIEAGTEVFTGKGRLDTSAYSVDIT